MTREEAIQELRKLADDDDYESAHIQADSILTELLTELGYQDVVEVYDKVGKWYA